MSWAIEGHPVKKKKNRIPIWQKKKNCPNVDIVLESTTRSRDLVQKFLHGKSFKHPSLQASTWALLPSQLPFLPLPHPTPMGKLITINAFTALMFGSQTRLGFPSPTLPPTQAVLRSELAGWKSPFCSCRDAKAKMLFRQQERLSHALCMEYIWWLLLEIRLLTKWIYGLIQHSSVFP